MTWTADRVDRLRVLADEGLTAEIIGDRLGVGKNAVLGKCYRMGIKLYGSPGARNTRRNPDWDKRQAIRKEIALHLAPRREIRGQCAWIDGDPSGDDWSYCGQPVEPERPYCLAHCERAYRRVTEDTAAEAAA